MDKNRKWGIGLWLLCMLLLSAQPANAARNFENEQEAFSYMISEMKLSPAAASGIMANIYAESNFSTTIWDRSGVSYGICQWLGSRKTALFNFCASRGLDRGSLTAQLRFMEHELETIYPSTFNKIKSVENSEDGAYSAAYTFCYEFERPASKAYRSSQRGGYARNIFWPEYGALTARLSAETTEDGIALTWQAHTGKTYLVYRADSENGSFKRIGKASEPGSGTYLDTTAEKGVTYYYQLRSAAEKKDMTYWSNKVSAMDGMELDDAECDISISRAEYTYTGKAKKPKVTVIYNGKELVKNRDYTVTYEKNIDAGKRASVIVTGMGDYSGTQTIRFRIRKAKPQLDTGTLTVPFTGKAEEIDVGQSGKITLKSSDRRVLKVKGEKLKALKFGTATITITAAATKNYKSAKITVDAVVVPPTPVIKEIRVVNVDEDEDEATIKLFWSAKKAPDGFEIQYTTKNRFGRSAEKLTIEKGKKRNWRIEEIDGLNSEKTWHFRIRIKKTVKKKTIYSDWSEVAVLGGTGA